MIVDQELEVVGDYGPLIEAKTALLETQRQGQELDNRLAEALVETAEIALDKERRRTTWEQAGENYHRIAHLTQEITSEAVEIWIDAISRWDRIDSESEKLGAPVRDPYRLILCSPGGDIIPGMKFYSFLKGLAQRRKIHIAASGLCASMATVVHQAATKRIIEPGCSYLIHEASASMGGRTDRMADQMGWINELNAKMREILSYRSAMSADDLLVRMGRKEWWMMAEEAVEHGFADEVGYLQ